MRVRGLKFHEMELLLSQAWVAPHAGAWIEIKEIRLEKGYTMSHPMRVRGLKFVAHAAVIILACRRTPCGCVD